MNEVESPSTGAEVERDDSPSALDGEEPDGQGEADEEVKGTIVVDTAMLLPNSPVAGSSTFEDDLSSAASMGTRGDDDDNLDSSKKSSGVPSSRRGSKLMMKRAMFYSTYKATAGQPPRRTSNTKRRKDSSKTLMTKTSSTGTTTSEKTISTSSNSVLSREDEQVSSSDGKGAVQLSSTPSLTAEESVESRQGTKETSVIVTTTLTSTTSMKSSLRASAMEVVSEEEEEELRQPTEHQPEGGAAREGSSLLDTDQEQHEHEHEHYVVTEGVRRRSSARRTSQALVPAGWPVTDTEVQTMFNRHDESSSGGLSLSQVEAMVKSERCFDLYRILPVSVRSLAFQWAAGDASSRRVSLEEFANYLKLLPKCRILWSVFRRVDGNGSNKVDFQEFYQHLDLLGLETKDRDEQSVRAIFKTIDRNRTGKIDFEEFANYFKDKMFNIVEVALSEEVVVRETREVAEVTSEQVVKSDQDEESYALYASLPQGWPTGQAEIETLFKKHNESNTGFLSMSEMESMVRSEPAFRRFNKMPRAVRGLAFSSADKKGKNNRLSLEEFGSYLKLLPKSGNLWLVFRRLDGDGNGKIDFKEFQRGAYVLGIDRSKGKTGAPTQSMLSIFNTVDKDRSGKITFEEFAKYFMDATLNFVEFSGGAMGSPKRRGMLSERSANKTKEEGETMATNDSTIARTTEVSTPNKKADVASPQRRRMHSEEGQASIKSVSSDEMYVTPAPSSEERRDSQPLGTESDPTSSSIEISTPAVAPDTTTRTVVVQTERTFSPKSTLPPAWPGTTSAKHQLFWKYDKGNRGILHSSKVEAMVTSEACFVEFRKLPKEVRSLVLKLAMQGSVKEDQLTTTEFCQFLEMTLTVVVLWEVFCFLDADASGKISLAEFKRGFELLGMDDKKDEPSAATVFAHMDADVSGEIDAEEFVKFFVLKTDFQVDRNGSTLEIVAVGETSRAVVTVVTESSEEIETSLSDKILNPSEQVEPSEQADLAPTVVMKTSSSADEQTTKEGDVIEGKSPSPFDAVEMARQDSPNVEGVVENGEKAEVETKEAGKVESSSRRISPTPVLSNWPTTRAEKDRIFRKYDENRSESLSMSELETIMNTERCFEEFRHREIPKKVFSLAFRWSQQSGKSDLLSLNEFVKFLEVFPKCASLWEVYSYVDSDGDGKIDVEKFSQGLEMLGMVNNSDEKGRRLSLSIFNRVDSNRSGTIEFEEFAEYFRYKSFARPSIPEPSEEADSERKVNVAVRDLEPSNQDERREVVSDGAAVGEGAEVVEEAKIVEVVEGAEIVEVVQGAVASEVDEGAAAGEVDEGDDEEAVASEGDEEAVASEGDEGAVASEGDEGAVASEGDEGAVASEGDEGAVEASEGDEGADGADGAMGASEVVEGAEGAMGASEVVEGAEGAMGASEVVEGAEGAMGASEVVEGVEGAMGASMVVEGVEGAVAASEVVEGAVAASAVGSEVGEGAEVREVKKGQEAQKEASARSAPAVKESRVFTEASVEVMSRGAPNLEVGRGSQNVGDSPVNIVAVGQRIEMTLSEGWPTEQRKEIERLFRKYDDSGSGFLSMYVVELMMQTENAFVSFRTVPKVARLMAVKWARESSTSDRLPLEQFLTFLSNLSKCDLLWEVFKTVDKDSSGKIDFKEFYEALGVLGIETDERLAGQSPLSIFFGIDVNYSGKISYEEFATYFKDSSVGGFDLSRSGTSGNADRGKDTPSTASDASDTEFDPIADSTADGGGTNEAVASTPVGSSTKGAKGANLDNDLMLFQKRNSNYGFCCFPVLWG